MWSSQRLFPIPQIKMELQRQAFRLNQDKRNYGEWYQEATLKGASNSSVNVSINVLVLTDCSSKEIKVCT